VNDIIPGDYDGMHGGEPRRAHDNPILMLHRHLRGRYRWVAIVGLLLAVPLAVGGYLAVKPTYTSTGMIRIAPTMTMIIYNDLEDAKVPAMFESMVSTQAALLQSRRVLDLAMDDPKLRAAGWPAAPEGLALLQKNLDVSNRRALELISASVKSPDGALAQAAVNAILTAYEKVYDDNNSFNYASRTQAIEQQRDKLATEIESARRTIRELAKKYATDELDGLHSEKIIEIEKLNQDIKNLEMALVNRTKNAESAPEAGGIPDELKDSIPVLAQEDAVLSRLLEDERNIQTSIDALLRKATKEHRDYKSLNDRLLSVREQIEARADELRRVPRVNEASRPNLVATMTTEAIQERLTSYKALVKQRLAEANELQDTKLAISAQRAIVADRQKDFDQVSQTLEQIRFESRAYSMGRVSVLQKGDLPVEPSTDRRAALAGLGAFAGFGLGGCIVLFVGIARGGYRFIEDVEREDAAVPLLGTIPDLADGGVEQEQMAALSVHHLRNMLQLQFEAQPGGKVYTITSASSGDGKTSLAIALAMSFAATGRRTIIVDTDLVGRGLTRQLELQGQTGLCEALQHDKLNGEVKETKVQSLWALPSGVLGSFVPEHLSSSMMKKLIGRLRDQYDAVILDTGPILGSLEANVVAPASDGCVLVVTRGQNAKMVRASIGRLRRLGATCSGLIFNRAGTRDFQRSVSTASVSARSIQANTPAARAQNPGGRAALLRALEAPANENAPHSS
jgi:capsular exopolysaccharide synthesis family protein